MARPRWRLGDVPMRAAQPVSEPVLSLPAPKPEPLKASFTPLAVVRVLRPKQWTKNLALLAPLVFANRLFHGPDVVRALLATVGFCLLSGSIYVFNDLADRDKDRLHPEKRHRPIASGALSPAAAVAV